ncbi:MAG: O-antigen ligase family protein [Alphaproteobacteria bacterium]
MTLASNHIADRLAPPWRAVLLVGAGMIGAGVPLLVSSQSTEAVLLALGLVLALAACAARLRERTALLPALAEALRRPLGLALVVMFLAWLPAVALSSSPMDSLPVWGRMVGLVLAAALIAGTLARSAEARIIAAKTLLVGALACGALALVGMHGGSAFYALFKGRPFAAFDAGQFLKYYASVVPCLMPVVLFAGFRLGGAWRHAALVYPPMALAIVLSLDSGAGLLGLIAAAAVGVLVWLAGAARLRLPALGLLALIVGLGLAGLGYLFATAPAPPPAEAIVDQRYDGPIETPLPTALVDAHRQQIWGFSLDAAMERPWFGHGLDRSNYVPGAQDVIARFNQAFVPAHPHNWIIEVIVDAGFVGLAALLVALGAFAARWFRIAREDRLLGAAGLGLAAAFFASSLLNFSFWLTWWQTVLLVLSALLLAFAPARPRVS